MRFLRLLGLSCSLIFPITAMAAVDLLPYLTAPTRVRPGITDQWHAGVTSQSGQSAWHFVFPLPPNTSFVSIAPWVSAPGSCSTPAPGATGGTIDCSGPSLSSVDTEALFVVNLMVLPSTAAGQTIHSSLTIMTADADPSNNTAAADTLVVTLADVSCAVSVGPLTSGPVYPGDQIELTFVTANSGRDDAKDVVMDVTIPPGVTVQGESSSNGTCTTSPVIRCTAASMPPSYASNNPQLLTLNLYVAAAQPGAYPYGCSTTWSNPNEYSVPQSSSGTFHVEPPPATADVTVALDATPSTVQVGDVVTYKLAATNLTFPVASEVLVGFSLPPALTFVSASPQCTGTTTITCTAGTLFNGSVATFTVTARAAAAGTVTAAATVSTTSAEANKGNNSDSATVVVKAAPQPARRRAARH